MEQLTQIIENYLTDKEIDSALFINGKWGVGKTFYWINEAEKLIKNTKNESDIYFKPIYISLNGISSTSDITTQIASKILIQKLPEIIRKQINSRFSSITLGILNSISSFMSNKNLKDFNKINLLDIVDFNDKVICFDDIERISNKISMEEILGFISRNFLENKAAKIIVIGSREDLGFKNKKTFLKKKEKIFYREYLFELNYVKIFESLCNKFIKDDQLKEMIKSNQDLFINLLKQYKIENLRIIRSILLTINSSFKYFDKSFFDDLFLNIILFTTIITKEFKDGKINYTLHEAYTKLNFQMDNRVSFAVKDEINNNSHKKDYSYEFYNNYIKPNKNIYCFFRFIYNFIICGYSDKELYNLDEQELKENKKEKLLNSLQWFNDLPNQEELQRICDELLIFIERGDILFYNYPYIYSKYENIIENKMYDKNIEQLFNIFSTGLDISCHNYDQIALEENLSFINDTDSSYIKKLKEKVKFYHEEIKERKEKEMVDLILIEFDHETGEFEKHLDIFFKRELFKYIDPSVIWSRLLKSKPRIISLFTSFIYQKYNNDNYLIFEDLGGLERINVALKEHIVSVQDNLKKYVLNGLIDQIDLTIDGLKKKMKSRQSDVQQQKEKINIEGE